MVNVEVMLEETRLELAQAKARIAELESQFTQLWTIHEPFSRRLDEMQGGDHSGIVRNNAENMLRLLQAAVHHSEDAIIITDSQLNIVFVNPAYTVISGYLATEVVGKRPIFFSDPEVDSAPADNFKSSSPINPTLAGEMKIRHKGGQFRYLAWSTAPILDHGKTATHYVTVMRDISQRKQHELLQTHLGYVLESIVDNQPLAKILDQLVRTVEEYHSHIRGSVLILDAKTNQLRHGAAPSLPESYSQAIDGMLIGSGEGSCGTAAYEKRMVIVEDIETDPLWNKFRHLARQHGLRACWSQPIYNHAGSVLGTFALYYQQPQGPNTAELELIRMVAHIAEIAMRHKQEQALLRNSEAQQRATLEAIPDLLFRIKADGTFVDYHAPSLQMLFLPPEAFLGKRAQDILPSPLSQLIPKLIEQITHTKKLASIEYSAPLHGELREFESRFVPLAEDEVVALVRDVTERKQAESALAESELRYRQMFELHPLPKMIIDPVTGGLIDVNPAAGFYFGCSAENCKTMTLFDLNLAPREEVAEKLQKALVGEIRSTIFEQRLANGQQRTLEVFIGPLYLDGRELLYSVFTDITERRIAELALKAANDSLEQRVFERTAELEHTKNRLEVIFNHSADAIVLLDLHLGIQQANYAFEKLFVLPPKTYLERQLTEFFHSEEASQLKSIIADIYATNTPHRIETRAKRSDGGSFDVEMSVALVNGSGTTIPNLVCIIRDVSARKVAELALAQKHQEELEMQGYLKALHGISIELAGIDSLDEFYRRTVEVALQQLGFERFSMFCYDSDRNIALGTYGTGIEGNLRSEHHIQFVVTPGGGMYKSLSNTDRFYFEETAALGHDLVTVGNGWNAIVALWYGDQNLGWLCADNLITHQPATRTLLETMVQYGTLIASTLGRKLTAQALEEKHQQGLAMQGYLKALHVLSIELERTETLAHFYQQTVELGRTFFGFERMRLLLYDPTNQDVLGTYQISAGDSVVDERDMRFTLAELPETFQKTVANQVQLEMDSEARLHIETESNGSVLSAVTAIWNKELLGWLIVTRNEREKSITKTQLDILMLYSSTIGALLTRRRIQEKLATVSHRLELATNSSGIAIWEWDLKRNLFYCDNQMYQMHGLSKDDEKKHDTLDLFKQMIHPDDSSAVVERTRESILKGTAYDIAYRIIRSDGEIRHIKSNGTFLRNEKGEQDRMVGANWDMTQIARSEDALRQALKKEKELGELKSRFVSTASHEFRTPLTSILAVAETLSAYRRKLSDEQIDQRLGKIKEQVEYLKGIMDDVLQLSRLQARRFELNPVWLDINELCHSVIEEFEQRRDFSHNLRYNYDLSLGEVCLDKRLMRQIINNLLSNAIKYSPSASTITMEIEKVETQLIFKIADQGIGVPEADIPHLFEPFHRAANVGTVSGTGLGLVITKESVELQGGTISVTSQLGVGTTFMIALPLANKLQALSTHL